MTGAIFSDLRSGSTKHCALRHFFLFIGAEPNTAWLNGCLALDARGFDARGFVARGFVATGTDAGPLIRLPLETRRPGIFAVGDVRAGSTKRVAAAVGEEAAVVAQSHRVLT